MKNQPDDPRPYNRLPAEERYHRDPLFHTLVDAIYHVLTEGQMTLTEVREAAMLATVKYETPFARSLGIDIHQPPTIETAGDIHARVAIAAEDVVHALSHKDRAHTNRDINSLTRFGMLILELSRRPPWDA